MGKLFGTDGVRGIANTELTPELAYSLGKAGAYVLTKDNCHKPKIVIAKDTRISGDMLACALEAGLLSMGADVMDIGILPTPAVAYLIKYYKADAGVVISASHNPYEYNGIKFFNASGYKLDDSLEDEIEDIILNNKDTGPLLSGADLGKKIFMKTALEDYVDFLTSTIDCTLEKFRIVIDCANGAAYQAAEVALKRLGAHVIAIHNTPNGVNINDHCGSTHPQDLQKKVVEYEADIGLAFDGDADRLIAIDELGNIVDGDIVIYILAKMLKESNRLTNDLVVTTVMSNIGFYNAIKNIGCLLETSDVGDRYVLERMLSKGSVIGGEQSGHIIFLEHSTTGDGILSALQLLQAITLANKTLSELAKGVTIYPQVLVNAKVKNENKLIYNQDMVISEAIKKIEYEMTGNGRVLIRPSGTEPLVRVMLEGKDIVVIRNLANDLAKLIQQRLG
ncbi:MAG: phosphoglucosamine mutase [Peptostreptococcales bacterium]